MPVRSMRSTGIFSCASEAALRGNPRMGQMYRTWERMDAGKRAATLARAAGLLERLDAGGRL